MVRWMDSNSPTEPQVISRVDKNTSEALRERLMDFLTLDERIWKLVDGEMFDVAEAELHKAKLQASSMADRDALDHVLSLLVMLNRSKQPPDLPKAESYCLEREQVIGTGYARAQYAMTLYWAMDDPVRTVAKAREAIAMSRAEGDDATTYQSLAYWDWLC